MLVLLACQGPAQRAMTDAYPSRCTGNFNARPSFSHDSHSPAAYSAAPKSRSTRAMRHELQAMARSMKQIDAPHSRDIQTKRRKHRHEKQQALSAGHSWMRTDQKACVSCCGVACELATWRHRDGLKEVYLSYNA